MSVSMAGFGKLPLACVEVRKVKEINVHIKVTQYLNAIFKIAFYATRMHSAIAANLKIIYKITCVEV
jgi:hypothetical protein